MASQSGYEQKTHNVTVTGRPCSVLLLTSSRARSDLFAQAEPARMGLFVQAECGQTHVVLSVYRLSLSVWSKTYRLLCHLACGVDRSVPTAYFHRYDFGFTR